MKKKAVKKDYKEIISKLFLIFFYRMCNWLYIWRNFLFYWWWDLYNRGFLYGPYLPVYGTGAILIYLLLNKFNKNPVLLFLLSILLTGVVEYLTGYWMYNLYHRRWWDYTGLFLNINGYVCLRSVLTFAFAALLLIYVVIPLIDKLIKKLGSKISFNLSIIIGTIMVVDLILTLLFRY